MAVKDIMLDDDYDLLIAGGDFVVNESDQQSIILIMNTYVGAWKQFPTCGLGISQYRASSGQAQILKRNIAVQLAADGFTVNDVVLKIGADDKYQYFLDVERQ